MIVLAVLLSMAAVWDLWQKRIPNLLIMIGFIQGMGYLLLQRDIALIFHHFLGITFPLIVCIPLYLTKTLGAGDIKLFSMIGCFLSVEETIHCFCLSFFLAGVFSLIFLCQQKKLMKRLRYAGVYLYGCLQERKLKPYYPPGEEGEVMKRNSSISFAVPILLSTLITIWLTP